MKIAREIEVRLERLVEGLSAALFRGRMHPVDLANRLIRHVDLNVEEGTAGPEIANHYIVRVHPSEVDPEMDLDLLGSELAAAVRSAAADSGWRVGGPIEVIVAPDRKVSGGGIACTSHTTPGPLPPWAQLIEPRSSFHDINDNWVILGRAEDVDVQIPHPRVSRYHATIYRRGGRTLIIDMGSANGTAVNGKAVGQTAVEVTPGDSVSVGPATFTFRLV